MLPMPGEKLFDSFFFKVFLKDDSVLNELAINVLKGKLFFLFLNQLGLFGFGFVTIGKGGYDSFIIVVFLL